MRTFERLRAVLAGSIGSFVEWYDWYTYSAAALYFAPVFFPDGDQTAQLLQVAAVFAVGFLARPIGAWLMGMYADRVGRKAALKFTVIVMCCGTIGIAITPGAASIGVAAPLILLTIRILQGLALGGEYGVSATYMSEVAGKEYRGFWSSFTTSTLVGGQLAALAVLIALQRSLSQESMMTWGWRVPFLLGALLAIAAYIVRSRMSESRLFLNVEIPRAARSNIRRLLASHPKETAIIFGLTAGGSMLFYVYTTYMQKFLANTSGFSKDVATEISALTLLTFMFAQPVFGFLSDKIGRKPMLLIAFGGGTLLTWPLMKAIERADSAFAAFALITVGMLIQACYTSISAVVKAELFPTHIRTLGVALPYAVANALFGGSAEYVALWFKARGVESGFYVYASALLAVAFLVSLVIYDSRRLDRFKES